MAAFELVFPDSPATTIDHLLRSLPWHGWTAEPAGTADDVHHLHTWPTRKVDSIPPFALSVAATATGTRVRIESDHLPRFYRQLRGALTDVHPVLTPGAAKNAFPVIGANGPEPANLGPPITGPRQNDTVVAEGSIAPINKRAIARWFDNSAAGLAFGIIGGFGSPGIGGLILVGLLVWLWEFAWLATGSATFGKRVMNLRVRNDEDGEALSTRTAAIRSADQFLIWGIAPMLFGGASILILITYLLVILKDEDGQQSPIDRVAKTIVTWEPSELHRPPRPTD